jgi:hypothetical protein
MAVLSLIDLLPIVEANLMNCHGASSRVNNSDASWVDGAACAINRLLA